jgi:Zn-dependent M28 family amino/carboxypeptidase
MKRRAALFVLAWLTVGLPGLDAEADRWWAHVRFLADDALEGRDTGSPGYRKAAAYVAGEFQKAGLAPAGTDGYLQPVTFRSRRILEEKSSLALVRGGKVEPITLGGEATISMRVDSAPQLEAPLVFVAHGLRIPEAKYDDLDGLDLRGKVVLFLSGGPSRISGPLLSHYQSVRWSYLKDTGALGTLSITNPKSMDIPWERNILSRFQPSLTLADPALDETAGQKLAVTVNPARAEKFFAGTGHTFKEILALAEAGKPLPRFELPASLRATVAVRSEDIESPNVVALLPGSDPVLKDEYVVLSAHLDHDGVGAAINGDRIYNGAMDNASGVAGLIETAVALREARPKLRRSLVFLAVTAEEKGLLGSRFYANHPTVPVDRIVANLNTDMFLPIIPMRSVNVSGFEESDLADDVRKAAKAIGVEVLPDPEPERNIFTRSDQYSFIKRGVPAIFPKIGFWKDSPEHEIMKRWRTERYHAPSDDLNQPVDFKAAADFNRLYLAIVESVANRPARPRWNADSFFRRFAQP